MAASRTIGIPDTPFVNEVRLGPRQWAAALAVLCLVAVATPRLWKKAERFEPGPDYRIPYALSRDYWLWERRLEKAGPDRAVVLGDSVVWGEYVRPDGTLTHFLDAQSGRPGSFVNAGMNGLFPLALEGLVHSYGGPLRHRRVLLHCNLLWMSSPKADLRTDKEERFNHADLVPQFSPRIPCYKADMNRRLAAVVERNFPFAQWATHLQMAYFGQKSIPAWTLEDDGADPPRYPNAWRNPLRQITLTVPAEPDPDPERGPGSPRHKPWSTEGEGSARFDWVDLDQSLQWAAFRRTVERLRARGNAVLVLVGPFNEHMMAAENRPAFRRLRDGAVAWLKQNRVASVAPEALPAGLYADANHPLTEGYRQLAGRLWADAEFQAWWTR